MKLLIIAYYFPPSQSSGVFRTLAFVRHLAARGWDITVLTVEPSFDHRDNLLLNKVPNSVRVVRAKERDIFFLWGKLKQKIIKSSHQNTRASSQADIPIEKQHKKSFLSRFKEQFTALLKIPDSQVGWLLPAYLIGRRLPKPEIIYSSAPPFTGHVVGALLKRKWNIPLILDFRDPWGGNPFRQSYGGLADKWDNILERWVCNSCDHIIANTDPMAEMIAGRFPRLKQKITVITNGYDPEEFEAIESLREVPENRLLFLHPGVLYGRRDPLPFLRAVRQAVHDERMDSILVLLIGQHERFAGKTLETHIAEMQLDNHVQLLPPMPHERILSLMKGADLLLLLALGTSLQVPAKLFEYLGIGKPIFAVCEPESATLQIMHKLGTDHFCMENSEAEILHTLKQVYSDWLNERLPDCLNNAATTTLFDRSVLASKLDTILHEELRRNSW